MKIILTVAVASAFWISAVPIANAHGGGLNAEGCHNDRKHGGYHCHRAPTKSRPPQSLRSEVPKGTSTPSRAFPNCAAARAAGAAPVRRGQPGYGPHLDRDGDGVGCE